MSATTDSPIPLTTTFTPPAACFTNTWLIEYVSGTDYYDKIVTGTDTSWWMSLGPRNTGSCYPSGYQASSIDFYYSPGICPSGYWVAKDRTVTSDGEEETRATCCPDNYTANPDTTRLSWYTHNVCTSYNAYSDQLWTFTKAGTTSSTIRADGINAQGISIRWKSGDFAPKTTTAGTITSSPISESTTGAATQDAANGTSGTLSTGVKAGIGVAAAVGAIMMVTIAVLCWMVRRKNKRAEEAEEAGKVMISASGRPQIPLELNAVYIQRAELDPRGRQIPVELDTGTGVEKF
ncbi:unnamed protein product [Penicillium manginii]